MLAHARRHGRDFFDRELYFPQAWTDNSNRRQEAGVPDVVNFQTKLESTQHMIERVLVSDAPGG